MFVQSVQFETLSSSIHIPSTSEAVVVAAEVAPEAAPAPRTAAAGGGGGIDVHRIQFRSTLADSGTPSNRNRSLAAARTPAGRRSTRRRGRWGRCHTLGSTAVGPRTAVAAAHHIDTEKHTAAVPATVHHTLQPREQQCLQW